MARGGGPAASAALVVALLAACTPPPTHGTYLRREAYGAIILDLDDARAGRVAGTIAITRLGRDGGTRVTAGTLSGTRDGDVVTMQDAHGARFAIVLTRAGAQVTAPDGGVMALARADAGREAALLADLNAQAARLRASAGETPTAR